MQNTVLKRSQMDKEKLLSTEKADLDLQQLSEKLRKVPRRDEECLKSRQINCADISITADFYKFKATKCFKP